MVDVQPVGVVDRSMIGTRARSPKPYREMGVPGEVGCTSSRTAFLLATLSLPPMSIAQLVSRKSFPPDETLLAPPATTLSEVQQKLPSPDGSALMTVRRSTTSQKASEVW